METSSVVENVSKFHGEVTAVMGITKKTRRCDYFSENAAGDDHLLVVEAKSGSASAFRALYERHSAKIYCSAFRILRNRPDAEDAVQRTFQRAFTNLVRFREDSSFCTWITRIAINEALMLLRQRRPSKALFENNIEGTGARPAFDPTDEHPTPEQALAKEELRGAVVRAISELHPRLRAVVLLREMHGLTTSETARRLGLTVSAVKTRIFHARRRLRLHFERKYKGTRFAHQDRSRNHGR